MLDRRALLKGILALAPAVILAPELILPRRTFFLPPRGGWYAEKMPIRWVRQYDIANDSMPLRFDAIGILANGDEYQAYVLYPGMDMESGWPSNNQIESARYALESKLHAERAISYRTPPLPPAVAGMGGIIYAL